MSVRMASKFFVLCAAVLVVSVMPLLANNQPTVPARTLTSEECKTIFGGYVADRSCRLEAKCATSLSGCSTWTTEANCLVQHTTVQKNEALGRTCNKPDIGQECEDNYTNVDCATEYECEWSTTKKCQQGSLYGYPQAPEKCVSGAIPG